MAPWKHALWGLACTPAADVKLIISDPQGLAVSALDSATETAASGDDPPLCRATALNAVAATLLADYWDTQE